MNYVLVVCDDQEDSTYLGQGFHAQPGNIPVICMNAGHELLNFTFNRPIHELPFLIILDQYLPDIDSLALLTKLKADGHSRLIPIAIMSGFASEELIRAYYLAGANCFYKKPLDLPEWNHMADCLVTLFYNH